MTARRACAKRFVAVIFIPAVVAAFVLLSCTSPKSEPPVKEVVTEEVTRVERVCEGDVKVRTEEEYAELRRCTEVTGTLLVWRAPLEEIVLPELERVRGDLGIEKNSVLRRVDLPALTHVGDISQRRGRFEIVGNRKLVAVRLPSLQVVGRGITFDRDEALAEVDLSSLREMRDALRVRQTRLEALELPLLEKIGLLHVEDNRRLTRIAHPKMKARVGVKVVGNDPALDAPEAVLDRGGSR